MDHQDHEGASLRAANANAIIALDAPEEISFRISLFHGICAEKRDSALN